MTHRALLLIRGAVALNLLELMTTIFAAVFVKGHGRGFL
jgi:hypothetical protein